MLCLMLVLPCHDSMQKDDLGTPTYSGRTMSMQLCVIVRAGDELSTDSADPVRCSAPNNSKHLILTKARISRLPELTCFLLKVVCDAPETDNA